MRVSIVVAMTEGGLMGKGGTLPWRLPEDLKHFKTLTMGHAIVMGRKTLDEIKKPLKGRRNLVVSRNPNPPAIEGIEWFPTIPAALAAAKAGNESECMLCGGSEIYKLALDQNLVDRMYITFVHLTPEPAGDTHFPPWNRQAWREVDRREQPTADGTGRMVFVTVDKIV